MSSAEPVRSHRICLYVLAAELYVLCSCMGRLCVLLTVFV